MYEIKRVYIKKYGKNQLNTEKEKVLNIALEKLGYTKEKK